MVAVIVELSLERAAVVGRLLERAVIEETSYVFSVLRGMAVVKYRHHMGRQLCLSCPLVASAMVGLVKLGETS